MKKLLGFLSKPSSVIFLMILLSAQTLLATGTIKGLILDEQTNAALPAANIIVTDVNIGTASDLDGAYFITNVPSGKQSLIVTYIGYEQTTVELTVPEDGTLQRDIKLRPVSIKGESVVITAQAASQGSAINQQITSNTITNVVSSSKIRELPDESAAAALSRLPGLSLMEGDKVAIRGIQAKQNLVLVNGIQLPSTDMEDRSTNLGFFSSNMLSGIEVTKVVTPDMDANAIGGVINLRLREAPAEPTFDMFAQGSFNTQDRTTDNYKVWASASRRFFGDKLGVFIQGNADRYNAGNDQADAGFKIENSNDPYGEGSYLMETYNFIDEEDIITNYGGSLFLDYKLPDGKIILQNALAHTINDNAKYRLEMDFNLSELGYSLNRDKHSKELMINALQVDYNFGIMKANLGLSHSFSEKDTDIRYGDPGNEFGFQNAGADTTFVDANGNKTTFESDRRFFTPKDVHKIKIKSDDWENAPIYGWCVTRDEAFKQHLYNSTMDFTIPVAFLDAISGDIKLGGKYTRSVRENDIEAGYRRTGEDDFYNGVDSAMFGEKFNVSTNPVNFADLRNDDYEDERGQYYFEGDYHYKYALDKDKMDDFISNAKSGWLKSRHESNSLKDDFDGSEEYLAAYLMADLDIGSRLTLLGGGRYEQFNMEYDANFVYVTHSVDGDANDKKLTTDRTDENFFPNAQLRFKFANWGDLRVAYSKTISRPDFQAIKPSIWYAAGEGANAGNPTLKPSLATNFDVYTSLYNNEIGLFTIGGFFKEIEDVFFQTVIYYPHVDRYGVSYPDSAEMVSAGLGITSKQVPGVSDKVTTYVNNPNPAYIRGFEIEWQTYFYYLPKPFNSLVLSANYTRTWSEMDYLQIGTVDSTYRVGRFTYHKYKTIEEERNARLLGQADHILNLALGVNYKDFAGRISYKYIGNVLSSVGKRPEEDIFTRSINRWDVSLKQKLPVKGLTVGFEGINIFHSPTENFRKFRRNTTDKIVENNVTTIYSPRKFSLYLRYNF